MFQRPPRRTSQGQGRPRHRAALALATALIALPAAAALAQDTPPDRADPQIYRDDRSDPASIVSSLYNAIDMHQYVRAWSYFGDPKPVSDYQAFVAGYQDTDRVVLRIGDVTTEGAAGSIYGTVPVAIESHQGDGSTSVFGGCYITRQVSAGAQEPPFHPLEIEKGKLVGRQAALDQAMPTSCAEDGTPSF